MWNQGKTEIMQNTDIYAQTVLAYSTIPGQSNDKIRHKFNTFWAECILWDSKVVWISKSQ